MSLELIFIAQESRNKRETMTIFGAPVGKRRVTRSPRGKSLLSGQTKNIVTFLRTGSQNCLRGQKIVYMKNYSLDHNRQHQKNNILTVR